MLTSYETLGRIVAPNGLVSLEPFVESIRVVSTDTAKKTGANAEEPRLLILDFDTTKKKVGFDVRGITPQLAVQYAMIQDPDGTQTPVPRLTNRNLKVVLGQGPHLVRDRLREDSTLKPVLDKFLRTFYGVIGEHEGGTDEAYSGASAMNESKRRTSYFFDTQFLDLGAKIGIVSFAKDQTYKQKLRKSGVKPHNVYADLMQKSVTEAYQKHLGDPKARIPEIVRWSLRIDGQDIAAHPDYAAVALESLKPTGTDASVACFTCGKHAATERTGHLIKFYTETNPTLYDGLRKSPGAAHFFGACTDHLGKFLAAQAFIRNQLNFRFAGSDAYVVPTFSGMPGNTNLTPSDLADDLRASLEGLDTHRQLLNVLDKADEYRVSTIDIVFYRPGANKGTLLLRDIVPSVPPARIRALHGAFQELESKASRAWGLPTKTWFSGFRSLRRLLKSHTADKQARYQTPPWQVVHCLVKGIRLPWQSIWESFLRSAYSIYHDPNQSAYLNVHIRQAILLRDLEAILMNDTEQLLTAPEHPKDVRTDELTLPALDSKDPTKRAMFALGVLLGYARRVQRGATGHDTLLGTFPFQGLRRDRAEEFALRVMEKVSQTQRGNASTKNAEVLYARFREELEQAEKDASPQQNAAYVLFGMCDFRMRNPYKDKEENESEPKGDESEGEDENGEPESEAE